MAEKEKDKEPQESKSPQKDKRISEKERYRYIGFEVFPGKPKDLFKSDSEKDKFINGVRAKREKHEVIREQCTLLEDRISAGERILLTVASIVILCAFLLPWYSAYTEVVEEPTEKVEPAVTSDSLATALADSAMSMASDSGAAAAQTAPGTTNPAVTEETRTDQQERGIQSFQGSSTQEEIITGHVTRVKKSKTYSSLTGIGSLISIGSVGSYLFSSGIALILTTILMILFTLTCIVVPFYNLYSIYGLKGNSDETALKLKKNLRLNWIPLIIFALVLFLSFFGASYGFDPVEVFTSIGDSYGPGALLNTLSWGIFVAIAASILVAVKGIEI